MPLDRLIHEPARLRILTILSGVDVADFTFLCTTLGLTKGNLSSHMDRLEKAGYVSVVKSFNGKIPHTDYHLTKAGRDSLAQYWDGLDSIRSLKQRAETAMNEVRIGGEQGDEEE
jgi:DNA-binding transcriptional ArsR family regulator